MRFSLLLLIGVLASGCATTGSAPPPSIAGPTWALVSIGADAPATPGATVAFNPDGRLAGSTGCNRFFGSYALGAGGALTLSEVGSTRMACPGPAMEQERRVLEALGRTTRVDARGDRLTLLAGRDAVLTFEAPDTPAGGVSGGAPTGASSPVVGPEWRLAEIRLASGVTLSLDAGAPYSLTFGADGRYSGQADCNRIGGAFEADPDGTLRFSQGISTLAQCPDISATGDFLSVFGRVDGFRLDGSRLILGGPAGALTLFRADSPDFGGMPPQETGRDFSYTCPGPGAPFTFRTRTGPGEIALWLPARFDGREGGTYRVLGQVRAASGVKYEDGPVTLWTHSLTEARLEVDGEAFTCTQTP